MSTADNKRIVRQWVDEAWNAGKLEAFMDLTTPNFVNHDPNNSFIVDREGLQEFCKAIRDSFPDFHVVIDGLMAEDDLVTKRWKATGTHKADFLNVRATGKAVEFEGMSMYRIEGDKIAEMWWAYDMLGFLAQIDALPTGEPVPA